MAYWVCLPNSSGGREVLYLVLVRRLGHDSGLVAPLRLCLPGCRLPDAYWSKATIGARDWMLAIMDRRLGLGPASSSMLSSSSVSSSSSSSAEASSGSYLSAISSRLSAVLQSLGPTAPAYCGRAPHGCGHIVHYFSRGRLIRLQSLNDLVLLPESRMGVEVASGA